MKLRQKILIAFAIMIILPCLFLGGTFSLTAKYKFRQLTGVYSGSEIKMMIAEPVSAFEKVLQNEYDEVIFNIGNSAEKAYDIEWLKKVNEKIEKKFSYIIVYSENGKIYAGGPDVVDQIYGGSASSISGRGNQESEGQIMEPVSESYIRYKSFNTGKETITVLFVTRLNAVTASIKNTVIVGVIISVVFIALTAVVLILWLYEGIIKPIDALKEASKLIGSGDLNFKLQRKENDEIGELCNDFEEMRRHLKTQIDQKEQYEQDIREMISNVSHDLKTPLTAIKGYAEGMLDGVADTPERRNKYLKTIMVRANDMTLLVDELSYYSKLDNNKLAYKFENIRAVDYFRDCVEEYAVELEMKDFTVTFVSEIAEDTKVVIDVEQIRRVMNNLIGNSVKYRNEEIHGELTVKLTDADNDVRVSVIDNGIGISQEAQAHIFERFFRADKSRTSGRAGTGIGLAIVKKIVEEHKGRTFVKSDLGKGTTISFTVKKGA